MLFWKPVWSLLLLCLVSPGLLAAESLQLSVDALQKRSAADVVIIDARSANDYAVGHIPGAVNFPIDLSYQQQAVDGSIVQPPVAQDLFRKLGVDVNRPVVIYDNGRMIDASRLFWVLEVYGIQSVRVLNGGFAAWEVANYPVTTATTTPTPSQYVAKINYKRLATKFTTLIASKNPQEIIVDARLDSDYLGKTSSAKRFGHIPSAINIPGVDNLSKEGDKVYQFLSVDKLKPIYDHLDKDKTIILYCTKGLMSTVNYLALRELGYDVANYDASWNQWGNDDSLPIETKPNALSNK